MNRRRLAIIATACAAGVGALVTIPAVHANAALREGSVIVVDAGDTRKTVSRGSHATPFSIRLPEGATCPGDSMHDDWRVQTFLVPITEDPGALTYTVAVTGPDGPKDDARVSLYSTEGRPYVQQLLGANTAPGQPGEIPDLPALSFKRLPVDYLPTGDYRMGVACTDFEAKTATYWDTSVRITSSADAMTWTVIAEQPQTGDSSNGRWLSVLLVVLGAGLFGLAVVIWRRAGRGNRSEGALP